MFAHAVRVALEKIDGVEAVEVSLNEGRARIRLRSGNHVGLDQIRNAVRQNGFTPREASVSARARVSAGADPLRLGIEGTADTFTIAQPRNAAAERAIAELRSQQSTLVDVQGTIPQSVEDGPRMIHVTAVKRVTIGPTWRVGPTYEDVR